MQEGCEVAAMGIAEMDVDDRVARTQRQPTTTHRRRRHRILCVVGLHGRHGVQLQQPRDARRQQLQYSLCPDFNGDGQVKPRLA